MKKIFTFLVLTISGFAAYAAGHTVTISNQTNVSCYGGSNASATVAVSGGVGPFSYNWAPAGGSNATIVGLAAGTYTVTVTDGSDGSTATAFVAITQPSQLITTVSNSGPSCSGTTVALYSAVTGGTPAYLYSWSPSSGLSNPNVDNPLATPSGTSSYTLTVTDMNGCITNSYTTLVVNPNPTITVNSPIICAGQAAVLTASGASSYNWSPGGISGNPYTVVPTVTTTYTVTGTLNGCIGTAISTVTVNSSPAISLTPLPATCGACNGAVTTSTSGATAFSWTGPSGYSSTVMNPGNLCVGTYTLSATSASGCNANAVTTISNSSNIVATIGSITSSNCGACNGSATAFASGGNPPYAFLWSPSGNTTATHNNLCAGVYTVTVTDQNGCSVTATAAISNSATITGTISSVATGCGACNGSANVTPTGGTGPYLYTWTGPGSFTGQGTPNISGLCVGSYAVTITDANGCAYSANTNITNTSPVFVTGNSIPSDCGACNGTVTIVGSGGSTPYVYDLNNGSSQQTNGNFSGVCSGIYIGTVTDANGCNGIYTVFVPSTNSSNFTVNNTIQNESGYGLHNGSIELTVSGSAPPYTFSWSNGAVTEDIYSLPAGSYNVTITDNNGNCGTYYYSVSTVSSYGYITGYSYSDNNSNCIFDSGDAPLSGYNIYATNGINNYWGYTNPSGYYSIWAPTGNYTVSSYNNTNLAACTNAYSVSVAGGSTNTNNNFSYTIPPIYDVCVYTWCNGIVPGFNGYYNVSLYNSGNQSASGVAYLVLPGIVDYISSTPMASNISGDTIFWNYNNLLPYSYSYFTVTFNTPPIAVLGTATIAYVNATVTNGVDANPGCNSYYYTRIITGSFDPNEKTVSPSGEGATGDIPLTEDEFTYLIRFQNTGSGPAVNIEVTDTLSSMLDPMSFQMLNASHSYVVDMLPGNVIRWRFNNINLIDSTSNEAGSHGHIQFKIAKLNAPSYGQVIENKANIYFDFNAPVVTNTAINTYALPMGIDEQTNANGRVNVYPNPFTDNTTFVIQSDNLNETYTFEMTDILGKTVKEMNVSQKQFTISRNDLKNGIYFYKIFNKDGVVGIGKVIIK